MSSTLVDAGASWKARSMMVRLCMDRPGNFVAVMNDQMAATFLGPGAAARRNSSVARRRLAVLEILEPPRATLLRGLRGDRLDLRLLGLARFLARSLLSLGHRDSLLVTFFAVLQHRCCDLNSL